MRRARVNAGGRAAPPASVQHTQCTHTPQRVASCASLGRAVRWPAALRPHLHDVQVLAGGHALLVKPQPLLNLRMGASGWWGGGVGGVAGGWRVGWRVG